MKTKVFYYRFTQSKHFIDTHSELAEFIALDYKNGHQLSCAIYDLTSILYNHRDKSTGCLVSKITTMSNVHLKMAKKGYLSKMIFQKNITVDKAIIQQAYYITLVNSKIHTPRTLYWSNLGGNIHWKRYHQSSQYHQVALLYLPDS